MQTKIIIAIDGYSSCGKSTLAKALAEKLNYNFIDTGAMYRAITLYFIENKVDITDTYAINNALDSIKLKFIFNEAKGLSDIYLNGINVADQIREMYVANKVSEVAALKNVRRFAVAQQQLMGEDKGIVMDGRDIGTVVFPNAELKIFLTADSEIRVLRRYNELITKTPSITIEEVRENLQNRDYLDATREESPLKKALDATVLDNSNLNPEEQLALVLSWAAQKMRSIK